MPVTHVLLSSFRLSHDHSQIKSSRGILPRFVFPHPGKRLGAVRIQYRRPGTGTQLTQVGDDFEDESWSFVFNNPKSTEDIDENQRQPLGQSTNKRWYEGAKRGHPDIVQRVPTPEGGLEGSTGALLLKSLYTGIPNRPSRKMHQDDFICNVQYRIGARSQSLIPPT